MLLLLSQHGYSGFNRFLMNPSAPQAAERATIRPSKTPWKRNFWRGGDSIP